MQWHWRRDTPLCMTNGIKDTNTVGCSSLHYVLKTSPTLTIVT